MEAGRAQASQAAPPAAHGPGNARFGGFMLFLRSS
jgi:hypothetical protein